MLADVRVLPPRRLQLVRDFRLLRSRLAQMLLLLGSTGLRWMCRVVVVVLSGSSARGVLVQAENARRLGHLLGVPARTARMRRLLL